MIYKLLIILLIEFIAYLLNILTAFNIFLLLYSFFNLIYSFFGFTQKERELRENYPIKFKFSIIYLCKIIIRGVKIKGIIIMDLLKEKKFLICLLLILIVLIVRYYRSNLLISFFTSINIVMSDLFFILSLTINETLPYKYEFLGIKIEKPEEDFMKAFVSQMKKTGDELRKMLGFGPNVIKSETEITTKEKNQILQIKSKNPEVTPFKVSRYVKYHDHYMLRNFLHYFKKTSDGFMLFDKSYLSPCREFLEKPTLEEQLLYLQDNTYEILQCNKNTRTNPIIKEVHNKIETDIVPFLDEKGNWFQTGLDYNNIDPNQYLYEIPFYPKLKEFFAQQGLNMMGLQGIDLKDEPDLCIFPLSDIDGHVQFCQLKFRSNFADLRRIIVEGSESYPNTDWCVYITVDQFLVEQRIFDNPVDYQNRKITNIIRHQYMFSTENSTIVENLKLSKEHLDYLNSKIDNHREILIERIQKEKVNNEIKSYASTNDLSIDDSPCIKPSDVKKRKIK